MQIDNSTRILESHNAVRYLHHQTTGRVVGHLWSTAGLSSRMTMMQVSMSQTHPLICAEADMEKQDLRGCLAVVAFSLPWI